MSDEPYGSPTGPVKSTWPSQLAGGRSQRSDARRTRTRLLQAAGELLAGADPFTLADVAAAAGVSTATAYRHFDSAGHVGAAFISGFLDDVEERTGAAALRDAPEDRLLDLCRIWAQAVLDWGPALAHLRSPEGFLARRLRSEPDVTRSLRDVEPALAALVPDGAPATALPYLVSVWNALADPREVLEQQALHGWPADAIAERLHRAVLAVARADA